MTDSQLQTTETKAEIKSRLERLETLYDLSLDIFAAKNLDDLLRVVMSRVTSALGADRSTLFIVNQDAEILWSKVAQGTEPIILPMGVGLAGMVAASGETLNIPDAYLDDRFNSEIDKKTGYHTKTILCMPVKDREGNVVAVIQAINKIGGAFSEDDEDFLRALSAQIQLAIENSTLYQGLKELFESMIEALASTIDARHPTTAGHTNRVRNYSLEIAKEMGYSPADLEILNYAALLHDYGKIGVPEAILTKPGKLTDVEYEAMKRHANYTIEILSRIKFPKQYREIPNIAGHHHEKMDGSGYPDGLSGDNLHPLSRVMAVADVFDAMTSFREYRNPANPDKVLEMLKADSGTAFDGDAVDAFERYYHKSNLGDLIRDRNDEEKAALELARAETG
ncbi:MAG: GAF domain-containing protein [Candidatus Omnitrophica bacterium]|nr:GAF domain-containing protein [Candidatus Omnitrophota bacterium]MCB9770179.1 GAF domain-containing protein [Candidatus Omnitrophota bacterium]MCB9782221.1 GAF domain-containing protein [Candidatus Omnitrophota bacterium]